MDTKVIGIAVVLVVVLAIGVLFLLYGGSGSSESSEQGASTISSSEQAESTTTTQSASTSTSSSTESQSSQTQVDIEGTWQGSYTSQHGSGEWTWVIRKTGENEYVGCIKVSGIYPTNGWLPITVSLEGSKITIGTVSGNSAVFTGTVSGNSMSGEWRFTNGFDQGSWQGTKVSGDNSLPCAPETPSTSTTTTTQHSGGGAVCSFPPPPGYSDAFNSMYDAAATVFGSENLVCYYSGMVGGVQYAATFMLSNYDNSQAQQYAGEIVEQLNANGWSNATITYVNDSGFQVGGVYINGQTPLMGALSVIISGEEVDLTIQIQPMTPG